MPERIDCVDDADCRQTFRDIADVLVLDAGSSPWCGRTASLEADELAAVGVIHLRAFKAHELLLEFTRLIDTWDRPFFRATTCSRTPRFKWRQRRPPGQSRKRAGGMGEKKTGPIPRGAGAAHLCYN
jgi:hypothetical protein